MPIDRKLYPPDWKQISKRIRFERAGGQCEREGCTARHGEPHPVTGKKVKLQTAHLNRTPMDVRDENLLALCARCHFAYDWPDNQAKKKYRWYFKNGQQCLPFVNETTRPQEESGLSGNQDQ